MSTEFSNLKYFDGENFRRCNIRVEDGKATLDLFDIVPEDEPLFCVFPGFVDVHVHFREPGFSYKETIKTGSQAAAAGGYTDVCTMPNLNPVPDNLENLHIQKSIIDKTAVIGVHPYGSITEKQQGLKISEMNELSPFVAGFTDDGRGVQDNGLMKIAMNKAKELNQIIVAHCEDNSLLNGGYIHLGDYAKKNNHKGISSESEYLQLKRDIALIRETKVKYHVCHISTKESVDLIRRAKEEGLDITCETAPHYLLLSDNDIKEDARFKMNPPIRSEADRIALVEGIKDGTIDIIATDHAPHSLEEKSKGLKDSLMGVVGLETAFPSLYTGLVKTGIISLKRLIELFHYNPKERFSIDSSIENGSFTIFDLNKEIIVDPSKFLSMGRSTPFENSEFFGQCMMTYYNGKKVWEYK